MIEDKILTIHPQAKTGRRINKQIYEIFKTAIISELKGLELTHSELFERLNRRLKTKFTGNINWYGETVKLDLEARKVIARTNTKPQKYRLK